MKYILFFLLLSFSACAIFSPQFDEVVYVLTSGGFTGTKVPRIYILYRADKSIVIKKEIILSNIHSNINNLDSFVIQTAILDDTVFKKIFDIDINKIQQETVHIEDIAAWSMIFSKDKKILRSINSDSHIFPKVEKMVYIDNASVFKNLQTIESSNPIYNINYFALKDTLKNQVWVIQAADAFLLANYLCEGTLKDTVITKGHTISLGAHFPKMLIHNKLQILKTIVTTDTDGRYYCFGTEEGDFMTIDIGFNFLTHTMKESYEEWLAGKNPK